MKCKKENKEFAVLGVPFRWFGFLLLVSTVGIWYKRYFHKHNNKLTEKIHYIYPHTQRFNWVFSFVTICLVFITFNSILVYKLSTCIWKFDARASIWYGYAGGHGFVVPDSHTHFEKSPGPLVAACSGQQWVRSGSVCSGQPSQGLWPHLVWAGPIEDLVEAFIHALRGCIATYSGGLPNCFMSKTPK